MRPFHNGIKSKLDPGHNGPPPGNNVIPEPGQDRVKREGKALHKPLEDKEKPQVGAMKKDNRLITNKREIAEIITDQVSKTYSDAH